jgi:hypothetical protein
VLPAGAQDLAPAGLDCTPGFCMSLDPNSPISNSGGQLLNAAMDYSVLSGGSWSPAASTGFSIDGGESNLSCASSSLCMATATDGILEVYDGSSWSAPDVPGGNTGISESGVGPEAFTAVSCAPGTGFCVAAQRVNTNHGPGYDYVTYENGSWSLQQFPDFAATGGQWGLQQLSCTADGACVGVVTDHFGSYGITTYGSGAWGSYVAASQVEPMFNISCSTTTFCITGNDIGGALWTFASGGLSKDATAPDGLKATDVQRTVNCVPGAGVFCVGSYLTDADDGAAFALDTGSGWATGSIADVPGELPTAVSCGSPSFCVMAADDFTTDQFLGFQIWPSAVTGGSWLSSTIRSDLGKDLVPTGRGATTQGIAKHGYSLAFTAPSAGKLSIVWMDGRTKVVSLAQTMHPGTVHLKLSPTKAGRHLLMESRKSLRLRTTASFTPVGATKVSVAKTITLKR